MLVKFIRGRKTGRQVEMIHQKAIEMMRRGYVVPVRSRVAERAVAEPKEAASASKKKRSKKAK